MSEHDIEVAVLRAEVQHLRETTEQWSKEVAECDELADTLRVILEERDQERAHLQESGTENKRLCHELQEALCERDEELQVARLELETYRASHTYTDSEHEEKMMLIGRIQAELEDYEKLLVCTEANLVAASLEEPAHNADSEWLDVECVDEHAAIQEVVTDQDAQHVEALWNKALARQPELQQPSEQQLQQPRAHDMDTAKALEQKQGHTEVAQTGSVVMQAELSESVTDCMQTLKELYDTASMIEFLWLEEAFERPQPMDEVPQLQPVLQALQVKVELMHGHISELQQQVKEREAACESLLKELQREKERNVGLEEVVKEARVVADVKSEEASKLRERRRVDPNKVEELEAKCQSLQKDLEIEKDRNTALIEGVNVALDIYGDMWIEASVLQEERRIDATVMEEVEHRCKSLQNEIGRERIRCNDLTEKVEELFTNLKTLNEEASMLRIQHDEDVQEIDRQKSRCMDLREDVNIESVRNQCLMEMVKDVNNLMVVVMNDATMLREQREDDVKKVMELEERLLVQHLKHTQEQ